MFQSTKYYKNRKKTNKMKQNKEINRDQEVLKETPLFNP